MNSPSFLLTLMGGYLGKGGHLGSILPPASPPSQEGATPHPTPLSVYPQSQAAPVLRAVFVMLILIPAPLGESCPLPRGGMPSEGPLAWPHSWPPWEGGRFGKGGEAGDGRALSWGCSRVPGGREGGLGGRGLVVRAVAGVEGGQYISCGLPGGASGKEPTCQCRTPKRCGFDSWALVLCAPCKDIPSF